MTVTSKPSPHRPLAFASLAALLAIVAYANSLWGPFTYDDVTEVVENPSIRSLAHPIDLLLYRFTRPIPNATYAIDYAFWGFNVTGYHLTNLVLHVCNVLLLFGLSRRVAGQISDVRRVAGPHQAAAQAATSDRGAELTAFVAASLFAVHPLLTEAVSYVSGRSDLLVTMFFLLAVGYFRQAFDGRKTLILAWACFLAALGSKESAAVLPAVVLGLDVLLSPGGAWRSRFWRVHVPLCGVILLAGAVRVWLYLAIENAGAGRATWRSAALALHVAVRYLGLFVYPASQTIVPNVHAIASLGDVRIVWAVAVALVLGALALAARSRWPLVTFGALWFVLGLLPSSALSMLAEVGQPMAEHRVYLASCGLFMAIAGAMAAAAFRPEGRARVDLRWMALPFVALLAVAMLLTVARNRVWADPIRLWQEAVRQSPTTPIAYLGLAREQRAAGDCAAAENQYARVIALRPDQPDAYLGMVTCLLERGRAEQASVVLRLAMERVPQNVTVALTLASLEERTFRNSAEALRLCRGVLSTHPEMEEARECVRRNTR